MLCVAMRDYLMWINFCVFEARQPRREDRSKRTEAVGGGVRKGLSGVGLDYVFSIRSYSAFRLMGSEHAQSRNCGGPAFTALLGRGRCELRRISDAAARPRSA